MSFEKRDNKTQLLVLLHDEVSEIQLKKIMKFIGKLPQKRVDKAKKYRRLIDQVNSLLVPSLLLYYLSKNYGLSKLPDIKVQECGKPIFIDKKYPEFSYSHCDKGVCCAISSKPIGCDIQDEIERFEKIQSVCLHPNEYEYIKSNNLSIANKTIFTRFWTLKESYVKYLSLGLRYDFKKLDFSLCKKEKGIILKEGKIFTWFNFDNILIGACSLEPLEIEFINLDELVKELCE